MSAWDGSAWPRPREPRVVPIECVCGALLAHVGAVREHEPRCPKLQAWRAQGFPIGALPRRAEIILRFAYRVIRNEDSRFGAEDNR